MNLPEIRADDVGTAWRRAVRAVLPQPEGVAFHVVVRIGFQPDHPKVRTLVDGLLRSEGFQPLETVANTMFPASLAHLTDTPEDLAERYRGLYPRLRSFGKNRYGTYFGRLVQYPGGAGNENQLVHVIKKLRREANGGHRSSLYECAVYHPATDAGRAIGFPCLSSCAFHLDAPAGLVHLMAQYRNQHLVERGYGNYLGLSRLRDYVAHAAGLAPGELLVMAGHARVDGRRRPLMAVLDDLDAKLGAT